MGDFDTEDMANHAGLRFENKEDRDSRIRHTVKEANNEGWGGRKPLGYRKITALIKYRHGPLATSHRQVRRVMKDMNND